MEGWVHLAALQPRTCCHSPADLLLLLAWWAEDTPRGRMPRGWDLELTSGWLWSPHRRPFQAKLWKKKKKSHDFHSSWRSTEFRIHSMSFWALQAPVRQKKLHLFPLHLSQSALIVRAAGRQTQSALTGDEVQLDGWRGGMGQQGRKRRQALVREEAALARDWKVAKETTEIWLNLKFVFFPHNHENTKLLEVSYS